MATIMTAEIELKSTSDKIWAAIANATELFPKVFPDQYKSIQIVEGDGKSPGTVREVKYAEGMPIVTFAKEKILIADEANKTVSYTVTEGEILQFLKVFTVTLKIVASADGKSSIAKWELEFEKASPEVEDPTVVKELAAKTLERLDEHILSSAEVVA